MRALLFLLHAAVAKDGRWCCWKRIVARLLFDATEL